MYLAGGREKTSDAFASTNLINSPTFKDGNTQAVMAVYKFQDGIIISLETGATNMPK